MAPHIQIIATDNSLRASLAQHLRQEGFHVSEAEDTEALMSVLGKGDIDLILLGLDGLKRSGISMMRIIRERFPQIKIITINSGDQLDLSIESMRLGAYDDFLIPFDLDGLMTRIRSVEEDGRNVKIKPEKGH